MPWYDKELSLLQSLKGQSVGLDFKVFLLGIYDVLSWVIESEGFLKK